MNDSVARLPAILFVALFAGFWAWEHVSPARPIAGDARRRARNFALTVANFAAGGLAGAAMLAASRQIARAQWGLAAFSPSLLPTAAGVVLLDASDYWRHRVSHRLPWLWRLHRLHHTDPRVDVTTALRSHPLEQLLRPAFLVAAIAAFGIPPWAVLAYPLLGLPVLLFQHADLRLPPSVDRVVVWLVSTPAMHLVHHSRQPDETNSNYATGLTWWDRLFGSYSPGPLHAGIGLDGFDAPSEQTLRGMLANPWRRN
jgi:sterol desaturase/sphingolipid hydroxylase (fatty acid hydroxylase superfamily)